MNRKQKLEALDSFGCVLADLGEDFVSISHRVADDMIPHDQFLVTLRCEGKPFGLQAAGDTPSKAFIKALADCSDYLGRRTDKAAA
jgi:hypothetical protein